jgi:hypothetical protein
MSVFRGPRRKGFTCPSFRSALHLCLAEDMDDDSIRLGSVRVLGLHGLRPHRIRGGLRWHRHLLGPHTRQRTADGKSKVRIDVTVSASAGLTGRARALVQRSDEPTDTLTQAAVIDGGGRAVAEISASRPGRHTLTALIDQAGAYTALKTQRQVIFIQADAKSNLNNA